MRSRREKEAGRQGGDGDDDEDDEELWCGLLRSFTDLGQIPQMSHCLSRNCFSVSLSLSFSRRKAAFFILLLLQTMQKNVCVFVLMCVSVCEFVCV